MVFLILYHWELKYLVNLILNNKRNVLKAKTSKLKENSTIIKTSGWRDGLYIVRAKIGNKIIREQLVVKH